MLGAAGRVWVAEEVTANDWVDEMLGVVWRHVNTELITAQQPNAVELRPPLPLDGEQWASEVESPRKPNRLQQGNACGGG